MSRLGLISLVIVVLLLGGIVSLGFVNTHVQPVPVEKAMLNEAAPK